MNQMAVVFVSLLISFFIVGCGSSADDQYSTINSEYSESGYGSDVNNYQSDTDNYQSSIGSLNTGMAAGAGGISNLGAGNLNGLPIDQLLPNNGGEDDGGSGGVQPRFMYLGRVTTKIDQDKDLEPDFTIPYAAVLDTKQTGEAFMPNWQLLSDGPYAGYYLVTIAGYDVREDRLWPQSGSIVIQFIMQNIRETGVYDVVYPQNEGAKVTIIKTEDFNDRFKMEGLIDNGVFYIDKLPNPENNETNETVTQEQEQDTFYMSIHFETEVLAIPSAQ